MTDYPIDPTGPLTHGTIPDQDLDRMIAATIPTWRDLADQLTPLQIQRMEAAGAEQPASDLYGAAEYYVERNATQRIYSHIEAPRQAVSVTNWLDNDATDGAERYLEVTRTDLGPVAVIVEGRQDHTGAVAWWTRVEPQRHCDGELTAAQAREVARKLMSAADQLDRLNEDTPPFV